jgi:hypothetical protein
VLARWGRMLRFSCMLIVNITGSLSQFKVIIWTLGLLIMINTILYLKIRAILPVILRFYWAESSKNQITKTRYSFILENLTNMRPLNFKSSVNSSYQTLEARPSARSIISHPFRTQVWIFTKN